MLIYMTPTGMFERFRVIFLGEEGKMTPGRAFLIGALSKTLATVVSVLSIPLLCTFFHTHCDRSHFHTLWPKSGCKRNMDRKKTTLAPVHQRLKLRL